MMTAIVRTYRTLAVGVSFVTGYGHLGKSLPVGLVLAGRADRGRRIDEPFSALDEMTGQRLRDEFANLVREDKTTAVFITHSIDEGCSSATASSC